MLRFAVEAGDLLPWEWDIASDIFRWGATPTWLLGPLPKGASAYPDLRQVVHPEDLERFLAAGREAKARIGAYQVKFRVVRSDGGLAGYRWGVERKKKLLQNELANS